MVVALQIDLPTLSIGQSLDDGEELHNVIGYTFTYHRFLCVYSGTNVDAARKILRESGLAVETGVDFDDAAIKAVASLRS